MTSHYGWRALDIAIVGGGIGGLSAGVAFRRAGHKVTIYERADYAGDAGATVGFPANGTKWLHEWGVDIAKGDPVAMQRLIHRDWHTGEANSVYELEGYEEKWGHVSSLTMEMRLCKEDCADIQIGL